MEFNFREFSNKFNVFLLHFDFWWWHDMIQIIWRFCMKQLLHPSLKKSISWSVDGVGLLIFEVSSARARLKPATSSTVEILASQPSIQALHTVSSDWFLSSLESILICKFCLLKLLIFFQKLLWNIRSRLNSSTF